MGHSSRMLGTNSEVSEFCLQMSIYRLVREGGFLKVLHPRYETHYSATNFQASNH